MLFEERNEDASKALNASTFDLKSRHCAVYFLGINEDASKAINASSLNHKMPELCSLFFRKVRIWAKHLMLLLFKTSNVHISIEIDVEKVLNTSS